MMSGYFGSHRAEHIRKSVAGTVQNTQELCACVTCTDMRTPTFPNPNSYMFQSQRCSIIQ